MKIISDLHIHGKYSQATSKDLTISNLEKYANIKGLNLLGTGDFTHPKWIEEIKENLTEDDTGILKTKQGFSFMLQTEISLIYSQGGKGRRVHNIVLAPNLDVVKQITEYLLSKGRIDYDGRPIFKIPCPEFVENLKQISKDIEVIPAHCLLPDTKIISDKGPKSIKEIIKNNKVLTHNGKFKKVEKILNRDHSGKLFQIIPWYFAEGLETTDEHPFYAIRSFKRCKWTKGICRPTCSQIKSCRNKHFKRYSKEWISAKDLRVGDVLIYPRYKEIKDQRYILLDNKKIKIDSRFCRLIGYFLSEGYSNGRDAICFTFNQDEIEYIKDVKRIMKDIFNIKCKKGKSHHKSEDLIFYSKNLVKYFEENFYVNKDKGALNKKIPGWMLKLPIDKQVEIFRGWWYGDAGYTSSRNLMNQMKTICLRLEIIPSIRIDYAKRHLDKKIFGRKFKKINDNYSFSNLSFFKDDFNLLDEKEFKKFKTKRKTRHGWVDENYIYLPIRRIRRRNYKGKVYNLEVEKDNSYTTEFACVHNCWTPWFSVFGSKSGFDSMQECFQDQAKNIHAYETGLSSDPPMNWRIKELDKYSLVSFSDLHSFWPWRIGREATVFDLKELTYKGIIDALKNNEINSTIEFWPEEGKYHYDGHRACNVCLNPKESMKAKGVCPKCGKPLTIGVAYRVEELADREEGYKPSGAKPFVNLIPLSELISGILGCAVATKKVWEIYNSLISKFGNEINILLNVSYEDLLKVVDDKIAKIIIKNRDMKIKVKPGYDGVYGVPILEESKEDKEEVVTKAKHVQKGLSDFC